MSDEIFGDVDTEGQDNAPKLVVPGRCVNSVEVELIEAMILSRDDPPMIWLDEDEIEDTLSDWQKWFGARLTLAEIIALSDILAPQGIGEFRRNICIARELGPNATKELYRIACQIEGIPSLL
jgi:hypothetical protein